MSWARHTSSPWFPVPRGRSTRSPASRGRAAEIILAIRLGAGAGLRRAFERWFAPVARRLGWRPEFPWARIARWAERHGGVELIERRPMPPLGHFSLVRFRKLAAAVKTMRHELRLGHG